MNLNMSVALAGAIFALSLPRFFGKFSRNEYAASASRRRGLPVRLNGPAPAAASAPRGAAATARLAAVESLRKSRRETCDIWGRGLRLGRTLWRDVTEPEV